MESFSRQKRLLSREAYDAVFEKNRRSYDQIFTILARENNLSCARLGLAISKKNLKRAHDRNQVKRIVRESFRKHQAILPKCDMVIMIKRDVDTNNKKSLHQSLEIHWNRIIKLCNGS